MTDNRPAVHDLLERLRERLPQLEKLLADVNGEWTYEDPVYRMYHNSFKVFWLNGTTRKIVLELADLLPVNSPHVAAERARLKTVAEDLQDVFVPKELQLPEHCLNEMFMTIVNKALGQHFARGRTNQHWLEEAGSVVEAFFHAKFFLEMAVRYGKMEIAPSMLPSGWAAFLYLYNLR